MNRAALSLEDYPDRFKRQISHIQLPTLGEEMHARIGDLFPLCRSITGAGTQQTLRTIQEEIPIEIRQIPTGTSILDWVAPDEWNIKDAWIKDSAGNKIIDFHDNNLHVMSYSEPVHDTFTLEELRPRLHSLPDHPDWIPYLTSYYHRNWGFCLPDSQLRTLPDGEYEVCIDATLAPGNLEYGELLIPGQSEEEVLFSCYVCHPSMANDSLSGVAIVTQLAKILTGLDLHYSYRFLFVPETIGAIAWLAAHEGKLHHIRHGLVATCAGDPGPPTYKRTRPGTRRIDRIVERVFKQKGEPYRMVDFHPWGSDDRQYSSPGFDLPVGCLMRTMYNEFPEYHTSADDLDLVTAPALADSLDNFLRVITCLEEEPLFRSLDGRGEPQLGRRGLYAKMGGQRHFVERQAALLWLLSLADGHYSMVDIKERSELPDEVLRWAAETLVAEGLLEQVV